MSASATSLEAPRLPFPESPGLIRPLETATSRFQRFGHFVLDAMDSVKERTVRGLFRGSAALAAGATIISLTTACGETENPNPHNLDSIIEYYQGSEPPNCINAEPKLMPGEGVEVTPGIANIENVDPKHLVTAVTFGDPGDHEPITYWNRGVDTFTITTRDDQPEHVTVFTYPEGLEVPSQTRTHTLLPEIVVPLVESGELDPNDPSMWNNEYKQLKGAVEDHLSVCFGDPAVILGDRGGIAGGDTEYQEETQGSQIEAPEATTSQYYSSIGEWLASTNPEGVTCVGTPEVVRGFTPDGKPAWLVSFEAGAPPQMNPDGTLVLPLTPQPERGPREDVLYTVTAGWSVQEQDSQHTKPFGSINTGQIVNGRLPDIVLPQDILAQASNGQLLITTNAVPWPPEIGEVPGFYLGPGHTSNELLRSFYNLGDMSDTERLETSLVAALPCGEGWFEISEGPDGNPQIVPAE